MGDNAGVRSDLGHDGWSTDVHVERWQAGDEDAFDILYVRFAPLLARRVMLSRLWPMLARHVQVDDVVQEIWVHVIPYARESFTPSGTGSFLALLGKISDRKLIGLVRTDYAQKRGAGVDGAALCQEIEGHIIQKAGLPTLETPTSGARVSEMRALAEQHLTPQEYQAWELVEMLDYTSEEAGLAMDRSGSAVRGLLLRGRAKLIRRLESVETR